MGLKADQDPSMRQVLASEAKVSARVCGVAGLFPAYEAVPCSRLVLSGALLALQRMVSSHGLRFTVPTSLPYPHFHEASAKTGANVENAVMGLIYRMMRL